MVDSVIRDATSTLTATTPTFDELVTLYRRLRETGEDSSTELVVRYALAEVVSEILDYLTRVRDEFEKSIGLAVDDELERVFGWLSGPTPGRPPEQVATILDRWNSFERVSATDIEEAVN